MYKQYLCTHVHSNETTDEYFIWQIKQGPFPISYLEVQVQFTWNFASKSRFSLFTQSDLEAKLYGKIQRDFSLINYVFDVSGSDSIVCWNLWAAMVMHFVISQ